MVPIALHWVLKRQQFSSAISRWRTTEWRGRCGIWRVYPLPICVFSPLTSSHHENLCDGLMQKKKIELALHHQSTEGNYTLNLAFREEYLHFLCFLLYLFNKEFCFINKCSYQWLYICNLRKIKSEVLM